MSGIAAARARGKVPGRPKTISEATLAGIKARRDSGTTIAEIATEAGVHRSTILRALATDRQVPS